MKLLTEQLIEAGAKYFFVLNASGLGPLCDALVTRPQMQLIQATHEGQVVALADGYAKASGKTGFGMYSRVGAASLVIEHVQLDEGPHVHRDVERSRGGASRRFRQPRGYRNQSVSVQL